MGCDFKRMEKEMGKYQVNGVRKELETNRMQQFREDQ